MFKFVNGRIGKEFSKLAFMLLFICFVLTFSSAVYSYESDNKGEYETQMFENNSIPITQVAYANQKEIGTFLINSTSTGCAKMMDNAIKSKVKYNFLFVNEDYIQKVNISKYIENVKDGENLSSNSGWQKPLIITGEFAGSFFLGHAITYATYSFLDVNDYIERYSYPVSYLIGEPLGATCGTLVVGKLFHENGSTKGAVIGSVIGTAVGLALGYHISSKDRGDYGTNFVVGCAILLLSPPVGSILGYNIK